MTNDEFITAMYSGKLITRKDEIGLGVPVIRFKPVGDKQVVLVYEFVDLRMGTVNTVDPEDCEVTSLFRGQEEDE